MGFGYVVYVKEGTLISSSSTIIKGRYYALDKFQRNGLIYHYILKHEFTIEWKKTGKVIRTLISFKSMVLMVINLIVTSK